MRSRRQSAPGRSTATALTAIEGDLEQEPVGLAVVAQDAVDLPGTVDLAGAVDLAATEVTADADLSVRETAEITARGFRRRRSRSGRAG